MTNCEQLAQEYHQKFPEIPQPVHLTIIHGALGENATWSEEGFKNWYDRVGGRLVTHPAILNELIRKPHFTMYREGMILGGDWTATSILRQIVA